MVIIFYIKNPKKSQYSPSHSTKTHLHKRNQDFIILPPKTIHLHLSKKTKSANVVEFDIQNPKTL